ncbi:WXG100 family type VII secretion target [Streptomyces sp. AK04-3B]|uniref:WXG100 family type VII secretion target n=1 Tax=Streptomyces sp. AK04-3B TaxID=3028650 RepID=UPI0029B6713B|nr:WXG100 family type VII secretion target [Streptomyces sp. AK04-3B]MDX3803501.1 WXG100 family type VII secretion target [Streptomyces sp. AK04-3B]
MSGDKKPDHYQAERQDATQQNSGVDDAVNKAVVISPGMLSSPGGFGNTSFEGYDLNAMIDIVEGASPETLENAATALVDARDAINDAADELSRNLGNVDWEGEAHTAFYTWGMNLTTTAKELATYTDEVGTQVLAASSGLASVRKSMPPRDSRIVPKKVDDIPTPQRVDGNAEYTAAVKAEKDRQEAINQMYRLASFYTVSSGMMEMAKEPVFPEMPSVGVPAPPPSYGDPYKPMPVQNPLSGVTHSEVASHRSEATGVEPPRAQELTSSHKSVDDSLSSPEGTTGTEIDSVGTLPPQDTGKPTTVTSPTSSAPGATPVGTVTPFAPVGVSPVVRGPVGRASGFTGIPGGKASTVAQGRSGGLPGRTPGRTGTGPMGPMNRTTAPGQAGSRTAGPVGRGVVGGAAKSGGPVAKQVGGVPRGPVNGMGATNARRAGIARSSNGVVGGRPVTVTTPGASASKLPRGTVIGGEGAPASRATGEKPGQRGVVGAPNSSTGQTSRRRVSSPGGVVGTPKGGTPGSRSGGHASGGGIGVTRGTAGNKGSGERRSRRDERRDKPSSTDRPDKSED